MALIQVARGNTSSIANYAGSAGEVVFNYQTGSLNFWTNTADVYYSLDETRVVPSQQGNISGYVIANEPTQAIQKFSFASDVNTTSSATFGNSPPVSIFSYHGGGKARSSTHAYQIGGVDGDTPGIYAVGGKDSHKFPFSSDTDSTSIGDIQNRFTEMTGIQGDETIGYSVTGRGTNPKSWSSPTPVPSAFYGDIFKATFASDSLSTVPATLPWNSANRGSFSSPSHGYALGGRQSDNGSPAATRIPSSKIAFSSDSVSTVPGYLAVADYGGIQQAGMNTTSDGYVGGGGHPFAPAGTDTIGKMPFSSEGQATDIAELVGNSLGAGGLSSLDNGYCAGGGPSGDSTIQKFPFSSNTPATDIAELAYATPGDPSYSSWSI